jgi:hypothetical protein
VSDGFWAKVCWNGWQCPLCKGVGEIDVPIDAKVVNTGLIFCRTLDKRVVVGCPNENCVKWVDVTSFFEKRQAFEGKCPNGHVVTIDVEPRVR